MGIVAVAFVGTAAAVASLRSSSGHFTCCAAAIPFGSRELHAGNPGGTAAAVASLRSSSGHLTCCAAAIPFGSRELHAGSPGLPPLIERPAPSGTGLSLLVLPPSPEALYEWYATIRGEPDADPSWGRLWPTAVALARKIRDCSTGVDKAAGVVDVDVADRHVAELGCGAGLVGLAAAAAGARSVVLLDREPFALHCALSSAALNSLPTGAMGQGGEKGGIASGPGEVRAAVDDWDSGGTPVLDVNADVVVASDVLYDVDGVGGLVERAKGLLGRGGGVVLVADPEKGRARGCREAFINAAEAAGANVAVEKLPAPVHPEPDDMDLDGKLASVILIQAKW